MATQITMPQLGESVTEGTISKWLKRAGDEVKKYEPLCEVITDKVNAEVPSPVAGTVEELLVPEGETVPVGTPIALVREAGAEAVPALETPAAAAGAQSAAWAVAGEGGAPGRKAAQARTALVAAGGRTGGATMLATPQADRDGATGRQRYSPAVLSLASEHGIDLTQLTGTGAGGRITRKDVLTYLEQPRQGEAPASAPLAPGPVAAPPAVPGQAAPRRVESLEAEPVGPMPAPTPGRAAAAAPVPIEPGDEQIPVTPVRRRIAERMVLSKQNAPHAWSLVEVDVTGLVRLRERLKAEFQAREGVKLTYVPFVIQAVVEALRQYPALNSAWAGDVIVQKRRINIGLAVGLADTLVVPVIHDADRFSIAGLAHAVHDLSARARAGRLTLQDVQGGTFTVNNTGAYGSVMSAPIINYPQAAILSMEAIQKRVVVRDDDGIAIRSLMNACLSIDHRVLDGLMAGRFLQAVRERLQAYGPEKPIR